MKKVVHQFVQSCQICLQAKGYRESYPGKHQPLHVLTEAWHTISMDFIEVLPQSANANCILVVIDKFTRYAHFVPLSHPYIASSVAVTFMSSVYKLHGLQTAIVSYRNPVLTSKFWQHLFKLSGTCMHTNFSYHPQSDGQTERVSQCLEMFMKMLHSCLS
jgi:hypothetical protein